MASTGCPTRVPRNLVAGRLRLRRSFADLLDVTALRDDGEGYAGYGHERGLRRRLPMVALGVTVAATLEGMAASAAIPSTESATEKLA